jgi:hypothetical protein
MTEDLRRAAYAEIARALRLLRAPPASIALAESGGDSFALSAALERCGAPTAYLIAVGSHRGIAPDAATIRMLVELNRLVAEIAGDARTAAEVTARLRADKRLSFPKASVAS